MLTINVRYRTHADGINVWDNRKEWLTDCINFMEPDVFGAQEVTNSQLEDMLEYMPSYSYAGVARSKDKGAEFNPVFYRKSKFKLLEHGTFWLSENVHIVASKGWDSAIPRIVTWVKLKDIECGFEFFFLILTLIMQDIKLE